MLFTTFSVDADLPMAGTTMPDFNNHMLIIADSECPPVTTRESTQRNTLVNTSAHQP